MPKDNWTPGRHRRSAKQKAQAARLSEFRQKSRQKKTTSTQSESPPPDASSTSAPPELAPHATPSSPESPVDTDATLADDASVRAELAACAVTLQLASDQIDELHDIIAEQEELLNEAGDMRREGKRLAAEIEKIDRLRIRAERSTARAHRAEIQVERAKNKLLQQELDEMSAEAERMRQQTMRNITEEVMLLRRVDVNPTSPTPVSQPQPDLDAYLATSAQVQQALTELVPHLTTPGGAHTLACCRSMNALMQAGCPVRYVSRIVRQLSEYLGQPLPDDFSPFGVLGPAFASTSASNSAGTEDTASKAGSFVGIQ